MKTKILLVLPPQRQTILLQALKGMEVQIFFASGVRDAQRKLATSTFDLLLTTAELPDGSWENVLQLILDSSEPCEMIVCSRYGDERLWAEVLQRGGYDLLVEPYDRQEVHRIIQGALDSRYMRRFTELIAAEPAHSLLQES